MKYIILTLFLLPCFANACQEMSYDPWIHFVTKKDFYDDNGFMLWHTEGNKIYGAHMIYAGKVESDRLYDCVGKLVAKKSGNTIIDDTGSPIFKIQGNKIYDGEMRLVATINGNMIYNAKNQVYGRLK